MLWQDYVLSAATIAFSYALLPQIFKNFKEKRANMSIQTTLITSIGLYICSGAAYTLGLVMTAVFYIIAATLWAVLFCQSIKYKRVPLKVNFK